MSDNIKESRFYQLLQEIFTGAEIKGKGGFINLLAIKTAYYQKVIKQFQEEVKQHDILANASFKEEFFDKLYNFFYRYFSESGSIYFRRTAYGQKVYEQIYTDNKDVILFWKTHMLYYIKSEKQYNNAEITITDKNRTYQFFFETSQLEYAKNNGKKKIIYALQKQDNSLETESICLNVSYSKKRKTTKIEEIAKETNIDQEYIDQEYIDQAYIDQEYIDQACENGRITKIEKIAKETNIDQAYIEQACKKFEQQSEIDYFINKDAKGFLQTQLQLYLHQYLLHEENKFQQKRLDQIKCFQSFTLKLIDFISQFEDELVKIWNKPKFVKNSNYVITLDKLPEHLLQKIAKHSNLKEQIKEWESMEMVALDFDFTARAAQHKYLPLDTKHFKDIEIELLGLFENLDEALDGKLIHSENYQALNSLREKYKNKIKAIYIDPPYNTGNDGFQYKDNLKHSTWLTFMKNRLEVARQFLRDDGVIFVQCDDNELANLKMLMDEVFGRESFMNNVSVRMSTSAGLKMSHKTKRLLKIKESILIYKKKKIFQLTSLDDLYVDKPYYEVERSDKYIVNIEENFSKWNFVSLNQAFKKYAKKDEPKIKFVNRNAYRIFNHVMNESTKKNWLQLSQSEKIKYENKVRMYNNNKSLYEYAYNDHVFIPYNPKILEGDLWNENFSIGGTKTHEGGIIFTNGKKREILLKRIISIVTLPNDIVLDFCLGSGTTAAVAHKMGRQYIGIEQDCIDAGAAKRMKLVLFGEQGGISKELAKEKKLKKGGFFQYYQLEQYEHTLCKMQYKDYHLKDLYTQERQTFENYIFFADQKLGHILDMESQKDKIDLDFNKLYAHIDLAETLSNYYGLPIKKKTKEAVILQAGETEKSIKINPAKMTNEEKLELVQKLKAFLWWGD